MFEELIREIRRLEGRHKDSVSVPSDAEGYFDRECPSAECLFQFKIHDDDWRDKVRDEEVFCPFCGHSADSKHWWTQEQLQYAEKRTLAKIEQPINRAMKRDADRWNRSQPRNSFLKITMNVDSRSRHVPVPPAAGEPMRLKITCPACTCRYAVIGAAFFCPACGHNAADQMFSQSLSAMRRTLDALPAVRNAIPDRDTAETAVRLVIENTLQNAVTAFQRYAEALYAGFPGAPKARRNVFQSIAEGSDLWHVATGKRYEDYLSGPQLAALTRTFQQRHLLAHTQGLVDQDYINRSGDTAYRAGQRLVVRETAVREALGLIENLAAALEAQTQNPAP